MDCTTATRKRRGRRFLLTALFASACVAATADVQLPEGFVYVDQLIPDLRVELRYGGPDNFTGRPVVGYAGGRLILSRPAARRPGSTRSRRGAADGQPARQDAMATSSRSSTSMRFLSTRAYS
jgi:D-alanyl-D-alanine dipeptidase